LSHIKYSAATTNWLQVLGIIAAYSDIHTEHINTFQRQTEDSVSIKTRDMRINPLDSELNLICHLQALLGAHHIFHVSVLRVKHRALKF